MNGSNKRNSSNMASQRKENSGSGRAQNGPRPGFRTDAAISNNRTGAERTLKRWVPDSTGELDGALESSPSTGKWDQFAENERLFGLRTDYDENFYTTAIDRSHPLYNERLAAAERAARDIEKSAPTTAHVAEERVMDFAGGDDQGGDEEDKYSGVRRQQDFPSLASARDNKYTPPARRAPVAHSAVKGVPVDPAIISSQIKGGSVKRQPTPQVDETNTAAGKAARPSSATTTPSAKAPEPKADAKPTGAKEPVEPIKPATPASTGTPSSLRATAASTRASLSPGAKAAASSPSDVKGSIPQSATENVENALLKDFKDFATQQRLHAEKARHSKMKADAQSKLQELKKFANSFKLSTPVPSDLISIIAKDPAKQKQIQEKALQNAEELAKSKSEPPKAKTPPAAPGGGIKSPPAVSAVGSALSTASSTAVNTPTTTDSASLASSTATVSASDNIRSQASNVRPQGPAHNTHNTHNTHNAHGAHNNAHNVHNAHNASPSGLPNRHPSARGPYMQQGYRQQSQAYRGDRSGPQHVPQGHTGNLAERIRNSDQNRYNKPGPPHGQAHFAPSGDARAPPTGPANAIDPNYSRRVSALPPGAHMTPKLNPTTHEFRPSPFAASFNPTGPSVGSSPRSTVNNMTPELTGTMSAAPTMASIPSPRPALFSPIRRKTAAVDPSKCHIFTHIKTIKPQESRNWNDNGGLRPSYDTPILWRQSLGEKEKPDSTMNLTYKALFERLAFATTALSAPLSAQALPHGIPQMPHQQQLPVHLQQHMGHMGQRHSPHMPTPPIHHAGPGGPHGHVPHMPFNGNDDHRMMHSNSAQSFASPRLGPLPMYSQQPGPSLGFNPPVMQPFMPGTPQTNQYRSFSNTPQPYMTPQPGQMVPMVAPQHFVPVTGGIQQVPMYPGGPQFMAPPGSAGPGTGGGPPQSLGGSSGYPSPGRPVAPMMVQQGSQQGQSVYGMSPSMQYQQPSFGPQHPGQGGPMRGGYNNPGPHQFGTSPQNGHQFGPPHRNGGGHYNGKNYHNHGHNNAHQGPPPHHGGHGTPPAPNQHLRSSGGDGNVEEGK